MSTVDTFPTGAMPAPANARRLEFGDQSLPFFPVREAFTQDPPAVDEVLPGFFSGTLGMLVAPGGTGKSSWALQLAFTIATGQDLLGLPGIRTGPVLLWSVQDPNFIIHRRLRAIADQAKVVGGGRRFADRAEKNLRIVTELPAGASLDASFSPAWRALEAAAGQYRLVILDPFRSFHAAEENDSRDMSTLFKRLDQIVRNTPTAILIVHHTAKWRSGDQADMARGSSVLTNDVRWQAQLLEMSKEDAARGRWAMGHAKSPVPEQDAHHFVRLHAAKNNYGVLPPDQWYRRNGDGVLVPVVLEDRGPHSPRRSASKTSARHRNPARISGVLSEGSKGSKGSKDVYTDWE